MIISLSELVDRPIPWRRSYLEKREAVTTGGEGSVPLTQQPAFGERDQTWRGCPVSSATLCRYVYTNGRNVQLGCRMLLERRSLRSFSNRGKGFGRVSENSVCRNIDQQWMGGGRRKAQRIGIFVLWPFRAAPDLSRTCDLYHSSQQHRILKPLSKARD